MIWVFRLLLRQVVAKKLILSPDRSIWHAGSGLMPDRRSGYARRQNSCIWYAGFMDLACQIMSNPWIWHAESMDLACQIYGFLHFAHPNHQSGMSPDPACQIEGSGLRMSSFANTAVGSKRNTQVIMQDAFNKSKPIYMTNMHTKSCSESCEID